MKKLPVSEVLRGVRVSGDAVPLECALPGFRRHPLDCRPFDRAEINEARFWAKVERGEPDQCWPWRGARNLRGYGSIGVNGRTLLVHRVSVVLLGREIPAGMVIDHNCRNTSCCNPAHLDVVTPKRNSELRPDALSHFCKRGHEYTPGNTLRKHGRRNCRECRKVHQRGWRERHRGQKPQEAAR